VPPAVIRERSGRLRALGARKNLAFRRGLVGRRREVVVLAARDRRTGLLAGLTDNYVEVLFEGPDRLARRVVPLTITEARADRTHGQLEEIGA
jgi:threonylcarbamoyladenosine tRNA methylthiotransferase MtaB